MSSRIFKFKHIFFDLDGTLFDSEYDIRNAWMKVVAGENRVIPDFDKLVRVGPPIQEIAGRLFPDLSESEREVILSKYKQTYDYSTLDHTFPYPWTDKFLRRLHAAGSKLYMLTNKRMIPTLYLIEKTGWKELFAGVFTPDIQEGTVYKKSDLLKKVLHDLSIDPAAAVIIGDTAGDVIAGKNNSIATAGVLWGYGTMQELTAEKCDILLSDKDFEQWM